MSLTWLNQEGIDLLCRSFTSALVILTTTEGFVGCGHSLTLLDKSLPKTGSPGSSLCVSISSVGKPSSLCPSGLTRGKRKKKTFWMTIGNNPKPSIFLLLSPHICIQFIYWPCSSWIHPSCALHISQPVFLELMRLNAEALIQYSLRGLFFVSVNPWRWPRYALGVWKCVEAEN